MSIVGGLEFEKVHALDTAVDWEFVGQFETAGRCYIVDLDGVDVGED